MSLEEALDFYGPVEGVLRSKLSPVFGRKAREAGACAYRPDDSKAFRNADSLQFSRVAKENEKCIQKKKDDFK
jgi:hypothetical protein